MPAKRTASLARRRRGLKPAVQVLEERQLLDAAGGTFARFSGALDRATDRSAIPFQVSPADFTSPRGVVLLGVSAAADASALDPGRIRVASPGARVVLARPDMPGTRSSLALVRVPVGDHRLAVSSQRGTSGRYAIDVFLAGDADGDFRVDTSDLRLIRSLRGARAGRPRYRLDADVNRDGVIGGTDLLWARRNLGAATRIRPLDVTVGIDPAADPEGDRVVTQPDVALVGRTAPGAVVRLDRGADGFFEQATIADPSGSYRFQVDALAPGATSFAVAAADSFGQARGASVTVIRADGSSLDTRPPTIAILGPEPGLATRTNPTIAGRVADDRSGVASLMAQADDGGWAEVPFAADGGFAYATDLPLDGSADGRHVVRFRATDMAGNVSEAVEFPFVLAAATAPEPGDVQPPTVVILSPVPGLVTGMNVAITGRATDDASGVALLTARVDGGGWSEVPLAADGSFSYETALPLDGSADGVHVVAFRATDRAGNVADPAEFSFILETTSGNRAPDFPSIGTLTVMPGGRLETTFRAVDPDGDPVTYSIQVGAGFPAGSLSATGTLVVTPGPDDLGDHVFTVFASDGTASTSQDVTLRVVPDPVTTTRISGRILRTDGQPLAGVPVELGRFQTTTDADGRFTIELPETSQITSDLDIVIPIGDPLFDPYSTGVQTIAFRRAVYDPTTGTGVDDPLQNINQVTSFLDASVVYGSDEARAAALRANDGTGRLKTSPGDLMPLNSTAYFPDGPLPNDNESIFPADTLFAGGDVRANENVGLAALQTVLVREHNRLAGGYAAAHPAWDDEQIYQAARRMVGAIIQQITYYEFIPALLGGDALPAYVGYDPAVDPSIGAMFSTAAFRVGHTLLSAGLPGIDADGEPLPGGDLSLRDSFFNSGPILENGGDPYLRGLAAQPAQEIDTQVIDELRNFLFGPPGSGGMDLPAMNIQRGRDIGLPDYNTARADFGLPRVTSFAEITSDVALQQKLQAVYGSVDKIDPWIGGLAEDHLPGAGVGPLFAAIMKDQFIRTRDGDRFWFENGQLTEDELAEVRGTTLASLIERTTGITGLSGNVFALGEAPVAPAPAGGAGTPTEVRSHDGTGNNLDDPALGTAGSNLLRNFTNAYADGISAPSGDDRPDPRTISNAIDAQAAPVVNARGLTSLAALWGQLLDHDISLTPGGTTDTIKIHGERLGGPSAYPFISEKLPLMFGHEVYKGVDNVIARPIYLPVLDVAGGTTIDPTADVTVTSASVPGASVFVAAGSLQTRTGRPFTGVLSITEVPVDRTPAALPDDVRPDLVVTIQPGEMVFTQPAPLSLPNRAGWAPGTVMDLWSINPVTGEFDDVGDGVVSADGSVIETTSGGIRNSSWHYYRLRMGDPSLQSDAVICSSDPVQVSMKSTASVQSGILRDAYSTVEYQSLGVARSVVLSYDSYRADPSPIVRFTQAVDFVPGGGGTDVRQFLTANLTVNVGAFGVVQAGYSGETSGLKEGDHYWAIEEGGRLSGSVQADLRRLGTGVYAYTLQTGLITGTQAAGFSGATTTSTGKFVVVNTSDGPFGSGWGIAGLKQVVESFDGSVLMIDGSGSNELFMPPTEPGGAYVSMPGNFSTLVKGADGRFRLTLTDQTVLEFDDEGRLSTVRDRNANVMNYGYAAGRLTTITDPVGLVTRFIYAAGRVASIIDPAGRLTRLEYDAEGRLAAMINPDGTSTAWQYDAAGHMTSETTPLGAVWAATYDASGRVRSAQLPDGETRRLDPVLTDAISASAPFASLDGLPVASKNENVGVYTTTGGSVVHYTLDAMGQYVSSRDELGPLGTQVRDEATNLVIRETDPRGYETTIDYDALGNAIASTDVFPATGGGRFAFPAAGKTDLVADLDGDGRADGITFEVRTGASGSTTTFWTRGGRTDGTFGQPVQAATADLSFARVTVADVTGDDRPDLVALGYDDIEAGTTLLWIFAGLGDGTFAPAAPQPLPSPDPADFLTISEPGSAGIADFDGDGDLDILIPYFNELELPFYVFYRNLGAGSFAAPGARDDDPGVIWQAWYGDVDGDGRADRVDGSVALSNGDGTFTPLAGSDVGTIPGGGTALVIGMADLNGDGLSDLVVKQAISPGSRSYVLYARLASGGGNFGAPIVVDADSDGSEERAVPTDANRDGRIDLVVMGGASLSVQKLYLRAGDGTFAPAVASEPLVGVSTIDLADVDGDGLLDLVTSLGSVLVADDRGIFAAPESIPIDATFLAVGDLNGDGRNDVVAVGYDSVWSLLATASAELQPIVAYEEGYANGSLSAEGAALGDVDGDGNLDLLLFSASQFSTFFGNGDGTFRSRTFQSRRPSGSGFTRLRDYNDDGRDDVFEAISYQASGSSYELGIRTAQADGSMSVPLVLDFTYSGVTGSAGIAFGDFDLDQTTDFIFLGYAEDGSLAPDLVIARGLGDGNSIILGTLKVPVPDGYLPAGLETADLDGDGIADLVVAAETPWNAADRGAVFVTLLGQGDGTFEVGPTLATSLVGISMTLADVDGDRVPDLLATGEYAGLSVFRGDGDGAFEPAGAFDIGIAFGEFAVADLDLDGTHDVLTAPGGGIRVARGIGQGEPGSLLTRSATYDQVFNILTSATDERGNVITYDRDPLTGNARTVTLATGDMLTYTYAAHGLVDTMTDPRGFVTDYDYDALGRLVTTTLARGTSDQAVLRYEYDAAGNVTAATDANGHRTEYAYDSMNRLLLVRDPLGRVTRYGYDANGNMTLLTDANCVITRYVYDALDRLVRVVDGLGKATQYSYDSKGNLTLIIDPNGLRTRSTYDSRNRLVATVDPDGGVTRFTYDANGNTTSLTDANGNTTTYTYDARNRVTSETDPLGAVTRFSYDAADNLTRTIDRDGREVQYLYDALNRLVRETWVGGGNVVDYAYDASGNLTSVVDAFSSLTYTYDARDRVKTATTAGTPGAPAVALAFTYDAAGNVLGVTDTVDGSSGGAATGYAYDALDRLTTLTQAGAGLADKRVDFAYNAVGQYASITRYADLAGSRQVVRTEFAYDALNRLDVLTHRNGSGTVASYNYAYDAASRITAVASVDGTVDYAYDDRGQLVRADYSNTALPDEAYDYDASGNRESSSRHGDAYQTGAGNRLLSDGVYRYEYDASGNLTRRTTIAGGNVREFAWDYRNRLVAVTDRTAGGVITREVRYTYDALDRRIAKTVDGAATLFAYNGADVLLEFTDADGAGPAPAVLTQRYLHGPGVDVVLAQDDGAGRVRWLLTDHLGTVRDLVDASGTLVNHRTFDAYGNLLGQTNAGEGTRYGFTGRELDAETGLYYYRSRYYDAGIGRFIAGDSISFASGDDNLYRYVGNSPTLFIDPSGWEASWRDYVLDGLQVIGGAAQAVGGIAFAAGTSGLGAGVGLAVGLNGVDNAVAGLRRLFGNEGATTATYGVALELTGNCDVARLVDVGLPIIGSLGLWLAAPARITAEVSGQVSVHGATPRWSLNPRVSGQLADPRMGRLQGKLIADDINQLANNPSARRFWDARSNNINVIQEVDGKLLRVTVARDKFEVISVGPIQERNIANSVGRGEFIPLP